MNFANGDESGYEGQKQEGTVNFESTHVHTHTNTEHAHTHHTHVHTHTHTHIHTTTHTHIHCTRLLKYVHTHARNSFYNRKTFEIFAEKDGRRKGNGEKTG